MDETVQLVLQLSCPVQYLRQRIPLGTLPAALDEELSARAADASSSADDDIFPARLELLKPPPCSKPSPCSERPPRVVADDHLLAIIMSLQYSDAELAGLIPPGALSAGLEAVLCERAAAAVESNPKQDYMRFYRQHPPPAVVESTRRARRFRRRGRAAMRRRKTVNVR